MGGWWRSDGSNHVIDTVFTRPDILLAKEFAIGGSNDVVNTVFTRPDPLLEIGLASDGSNDVTDTVYTRPDPLLAIEFAIGGSNDVIKTALSIFSLGQIHMFTRPLPLPTLEFAKAIKGVLMIRHTLGIWCTDGCVVQNMLSC